MDMITLRLRDADRQAIALIQAKNPHLKSGSDMMRVALQFYADNINTSEPRLAAIESRLAALEKGKSKGAWSK